MPVVDFWIYPPSLNIRSCLHLKTISGMHNKQDSYLGFRETLRLHLFWISAWGNFLCLQSQISLNLGDNKSNCCYCLTKSVLVYTTTFHCFITLKFSVVNQALLLSWLTTEKFQNYETVKGGRIPSKNKFKTQKNSKLRWLASDINFKLLRTGCPITHDYVKFLFWTLYWKLGSNPRLHYISPSNLRSLLLLSSLQLRDLCPYASE